MTQSVDEPLLKLSDITEWKNELRRFKNCRNEINRNIRIIEKKLAWAEVLIGAADREKFEQLLTKAIIPNN